MKPSSVKKDIVNIIKIAIVGVALTAGVNYIFAATWTAPTVTAPGGNIAAPINTSSATQTKQGSLSVSGLLTSALTFSGGTPAQGDVLTATDQQGDAAWASPNQTIASYTSAGTYTWTAPSGVTSAQIVVWGGGGGGAGGDNAGGGNTAAGGSGAGGGEVTGTVSLTPGQTYTLTVGAGGNGSAGKESGTSAGPDGGTGDVSTFGSLSANGGGGGEGIYATSGAAAGGGGSGGTVSNGGAGTIQGGSCVNAVGGSGGGSGGSGGGCETNGVSPGGGGGGGTSNGINGGNGAAGEVTITYSGPSTAISKTAVYVCNDKTYYNFTDPYGTPGGNPISVKNYISTTDDTKTYTSPTNAPAPIEEVIKCTQSGSIFAN